MFEITNRILNNDETLKGLRFQLSWMESMSTTEPKMEFRDQNGNTRMMPYPAESANNCRAEAIKLKDLIDRRTYCLSSHLPHTCDCVANRVIEIEASGDLDHLFRKIKPSEGPIRCINSIVDPKFKGPHKTPSKCIGLIGVGGRTHHFVEDCSDWTEEQRLTGIETHWPPGSQSPLPGGPQVIDSVVECYHCALKYIAENHTDYDIFSKDMVIRVITANRDKQ